MIDIKDISGKIRCSIEINSGAKGKFTLMKEDYVILPFSVQDPIYFKLGDNIDFAGILDDSLGGKLSKIYELVDLYKPTFNTSTGGYDYELHLDAYYWKWKNKKFKYTPEHGGREASWNLTATLDVHLNVFLRNLKSFGYKYRGNDFTYSIDSTVSNTSRLVSYSNTNMIDALTMMAETWGCEWWVTDNVIHFGRCEFGDAVELHIGVQILNMSRTDSSGTFATRIYAFGSTKNIPENYRPLDEQIVVNGVVQKRLMLPEGTPYIDAYENMSEEEAVEAIITFDDVFPHKVGTLSDVQPVERTEEVEQEDGSTVKETYTVYQYKDTDLDFSSQYILPGQELKIIFQSGSMNGMEFGVTFNPENKEPEEQLWEIVRNENYGRFLPDDILHPKDGDTYVLSGFDTSFVSDTMIPEAEQELKERAIAYSNRSKIDDGTYPTTLDSEWVYGDLINRTYGIGQRVNVFNPAYFENGRISRVLGFEFNLDIPYDSPVYTIGESTAYSRLGEIESKLDNITYSGQSYIGTGGSGGGGSIYIIRTNDSTPASDDNVFSALRSLATFLRKDKADSTRYLLSLLGGAICDNLESQDFAAGPFGTGYVLKRNPKTGRSYLELDEIYVRLKAYFETLEIKHLSHVGGRIVLSPAGMECIRVEEVSAEHEELYDSAGNPLVDSLNDPLFARKEGGEKAYRCYFKQEEDGKEIVNEFAVDDLAQCREFNVKENVSQQVSNQYYWRRVIYVGEDYIDLSIDDCDPISMVPKAGDTIVTIGNKTDVNRQHVVFLSSYDEDAPCIKLYSGINSYSMLNKEVTVISPNVDKNMFTGQVVIKPGSTGFENLDDAPDMGLIEQEIQEAKDAAEAAKGEIRYVQESVGDLKGYVDGAFSDGIISESEAASIEKYINIVNNEKQQALATYNGLYNNPYLEGSAKTSLSNSKVTLFSSIDALINSINTAIADGKASPGEKSDVDAKYASFTTNYNKFYAAVEAANKSIQDKLKGYSDNAQMAADKANNNASQAMEDANEAKEAVTNLNDYVDGAFADGIISKSEAKAIEKYINIVNQTKKDVDSTYSVLYNNPFLTGTAKQNLYSAKSLFNTATSNLISAINSAIADGKTTTTEKNNVDSKYSSFNSAYASLATAIENANKAIQEKIKEEAITEAKKDLDAQIGGVSLAAKNEIAKNMGYSDYEELQYYAQRAQTIIKGGHINTELIEASLIVTSQLIANAIKANTLNINNNFIVKTDGSVDMNGILHSLGRNTELVISDGYVRIMYKGSDVAKLSVNENTGMPELSMYKGNRSVLVTAEKIMLATGGGSTSFLTLDASEIGYGTIKKKSDGTLYVASNEYTMITVGISVSPSNGGTTIPSPSPLHMVMQGESETVEAIPADGYEFDRWSDGGSQKHTVTWSTSGQSLVAYFTKIQVTKYTLSLSASPSYAGTTSGAGTYETGTRVTVNATPNTGYRFVRWSDGGAQSHYVTMDANKSLTAYFEAYSVTGDEIFTGTALTSSTYWKAGGNASISSVTGGVATIKFPSSDATGSDYISFNKGYLGSKIEQGHKYRLTFQAKSSVSDTYIVALFGESLDITDSVSSDGVIYGEYNGGVLSTSYKTITLDFVADKRDSTVSDGLLITSSKACTINIRSISLKEV
jgi:hypothetical protein